MRGIADTSCMGYLIALPKSLSPVAELKLLNGDDPTLLKSSDWKTWVLESEAVWVDESFKVVVPTGFMTDFASIPSVFRGWQTGSVGPHRIAAYFHDYLYSSTDQCTRKEADLLFKQIMDCIDNNSWRAKFRRNAMWLALRLGGYFAWRSGQKSFRDLGPHWRILR